MSNTIGQLDPAFTSLINDLMTIERQPLTRLTQRRDDIQVQKSVYQDLQSRLEQFQEAVRALKSSDPSYSFESGRLAKVSNTTDGAVMLSASAVARATPARYDIAVADIAREHRVRSDKQIYSNQFLGLSGSFFLGGEADRSAVTQGTTPNTVTGFSTSEEVDAGQLELGTGTYFVETRNDEVNGWQFRLVDSDGKAVHIRKNGVADSFSSEWQSIPEGGGAYDTGRGLIINLGDGTQPYEARLRDAVLPEDRAAGVAYTAKGALISVLPSDNLADIASRINNVKYADGNSVNATIIDGQLILTASRTGAGRLMAASDATGSVLASLGILSAGSFKNVLQTPSNAIFNINEQLSIERSVNDNLTDVIDGVTLSLASDAKGKSGTLEVVADTTQEKKMVNDLIQKFNALVGYLGTKVATTKNENGTYTRGALAGDAMIYGLRMDLIRIANADALSTGILKNFSQIGIVINDSMQLEIKDSTKLEEALRNKKSEVTALFDAMMSNLDAKLNIFAGTSGYVKTLQNSLETQIKDISGRIDTMNTRLTARKEALTLQFAEAQAQLASMSYMQQQLSAIYGSINRTS